jgi:hypothetical protein
LQSSSSCFLRVSGSEDAGLADDLGPVAHVLDQLTKRYCVQPAILDAVPDHDPEGMVGAELGLRHGAEGSEEMGTFPMDTR